MAKTPATMDESRALAAMEDYGADGGTGFEGMGSEDWSIPFLSILQSNSPQVESEDPPGAKAGMLFNTVTQDMYDGDKGVVFTPCHFNRCYVEWVPRNKGGGFVGLHEPSSPEVENAIADNDGRRFGKLHIGDNELIETKYMYGLLLDQQGGSVDGFATISFSSTKIKPFNDWLTAMRMVKGKPPLFAHRARLMTTRQKNEHGTFYNFRIAPLSSSWSESLIRPSQTPELLQEAKSFREMVMSGEARAAFETERAAGTGGLDSEAPPF